MGTTLSMEEQEDILKKAREGKAPELIAKETGHTLITVNKYLAIFATSGLPVKKGGEGIVIRPLEGVDRILGELLVDPDKSGKTGLVTGVNAAQLFRQAKRLKDGRGTPEEGIAFVTNLIGIGIGAWQGWRAYDELRPEERELAEKPDKEEIIELLLEKQEKRTAIIVAEAIKQLKDAGVI